MDNEMQQQGNQQGYRPIEEMTFREAKAELDQITGLIESNTLELEESLKAYERGVALIASLQNRIDTTQQRVEVLMGQLQPEADDAITDTTLSKA